ncbi:MAG: RNA helicase, partial [Methanobacteriota archaeon]
RWGFVDACPLCLSNQRLTELNPGNSVKVGDEKVCFSCGEKQLLKVLGSFCLYPEPVFKIFKPCFHRFRSVEPVLRVLDPRFKPSENPELTLVAKLPGDPQLTLSRFDSPELAQRIPANLSKLLRSWGVTELLPSQTISIEKGLLDGKNLLVATATGSGKTLVAEMAGILQVFRGKKFLYLVPLVAVANQKYMDFNARYGALGFRTVIRVGTGRIVIEEGEALPIREEQIVGADIVVGTYEGVDFLLRSGEKEELEPLGLVCVDEIHTLSEGERGARLSGLVARLKKLFPNTQFIFLSATVGNADELAEFYGHRLVSYSRRPIPIEIHIVVARSEQEKLRFLQDLVDGERKVVSSKGYPGQTLIFTYSRRNAHRLAKTLSGLGLVVAEYHAGLTYAERRAIEEAFLGQKLVAVVSTAALGAGIDFPASQVVFESLAMGSEWIGVNEFHQMLGRAGRPQYHDRGKVVLLVEPGKRYFGGQADTEDQIALKLIKSGLNPVELDMDVNQQMEQVLAHIASGTAKDFESLRDVMGITFGAWSDGRKELEKLVELGMVKVWGEQLAPTPYGMAVAKSFLSPTQAEKIRKSLKKPVLEVVVELNPYMKLFLSSKVFNEVSSIIKMPISQNLFSDSLREVLFHQYQKLEPKLSTKSKNVLTEIIKLFYACDCGDKPYCLCVAKKISLKLLEDRMAGAGPEKLLSKLAAIHLETYVGDLIQWMEEQIRYLEAIERIALVYGEKNVVSEAKKVRSLVENPAKGG